MRGGVMRLILTRINDFQRDIISVYFMMYFFFKYNYNSFYDIFVLLK